MPTISKKIADELIAGKGMYPGDLTRVVKIVKYQNAFDGTDAYGAIYDGRDLDTYTETDFIRNPVVYWEYKAAVAFTPQQLANWRAFELARLDGSFNMFSPEARKTTGLSITDYQFAMKNYSALKDAQ